MSGTTVAVSTAGDQRFPEPTKVVWCNSDRTLTRSFVEPAAAIEYANRLLRLGHRALIRNWKPRKRQIDRMVEQYPNGPPWLVASSAERMRK